MAKDKVNPKWVPLAKKLGRATQKLDDAIAKHERTMKDATAKLAAAEKSLQAAIADARGLVDEVAKIPPGQYPAITDKPGL
jgi:hypothetical protein